MSVSVVDLYSE